jgi:hypothetical protein
MTQAPLATAAVLQVTDICLPRCLLTGGQLRYRGYCSDISGERVYRSPTLRILGRAATAHSCDHPSCARSEPDQSEVSHSRPTDVSDAGRGHDVGSAIHTPSWSVCSSRRRWVGIASHASGQHRVPVGARRADGFQSVADGAELCGEAGWSSLTGITAISPSCPSRSPGVHALAVNTARSTIHFCSTGTDLRGAIDIGGFGHVGSGRGKQQMSSPSEQVTSYEGDIPLLP